MLQKRQPRIEKLFDVVASKNNLNFHRFCSLNVSKSGLLIVSSSNIDFSKGDQLDLVIDPWENLFKQPIACTAMIARLANNQSTGLEKYKSMRGYPTELKSAFGVYIEYMDSQYKEEWEVYIDYMLKVNSSQ